MKKIPIQTPVQILAIMFFLVLLSSPLMAGIGVGTDSPDSSAEVDISSTSKGILIPRMTATDRGNISSPATGLLVYQTDDTKGFYYYDGSSWQQLGGGGASSGPSLSFTNTTNTIALFPPLSMEVTVASMNVAVSTGNEIKLDYSLQVEPVTTADWNLIFEVRMYRDGTMISADTTNLTDATAATSRFPIAGTYIDTAVATTTSTYDLRIIITTATNVTSASAVNRNFNAVKF